MTVGPTNRLGIQLFFVLVAGPQWVSEGVRFRATADSVAHQTCGWGGEVGWEGGGLGWAVGCDLSWLLLFQQSVSEEG